MDGAPAEMRALVMDAVHRSSHDAIAGLRVATLPVPALEPGRVLVRIEAAPCNPADLLLLEGRYGIEREPPAIPGMEGSGVVVASGGGWLGRWLLGRRVICGGHEASGTWAEYCATDATSCIPLRRGLSFEQGATAVANPMTALALVRLARGEGHRAVVNTAAAGQLGQMIFGCATKAGLPTVDVVRRPSQVDALRALGAERIVDSSAPDFEDELARRCHEVGATMAFDAVAGAMTGTLLSALPENGTVVVYGALSGDPCAGVDPMGLAFGHKRIRGFEIAHELKRAGLLRSFRLASRAQGLVASGDIATSVQSRASLDGARDALLGYLDDMSAGKVLICPTQA